MGVSNPDQLSDERFEIPGVFDRQITKTVLHVFLL